MLWAIAFYFPADSVGLACCVMVGRGGLFWCLDGMDRMAWVGWDDGFGWA